jgi:hypothetical protein
VRALHLLLYITYIIERCCKTPANRHFLRPARYRLASPHTTTDHHPARHPPRHPRLPQVALRRHRRWRSKRPHRTLRRTVKRAIRVRIHNNETAQQHQHYPPPNSRQPSIVDPRFRQQRMTTLPCRRLAPPPRSIPAQRHAQQLTPPPAPPHSAPERGIAQQPAPLAFAPDGRRSARAEPSSWPSPLRDP